MKPSVLSRENRSECHLDRGRATQPTGRQRGAPQRRCLVLFVGLWRTLCSAGACTLPNTTVSCSKRRRNSDCGQEDVDDDAEVTDAVQCIDLDAIPESHPRSGRTENTVESVKAMKERQQKEAEKRRRRRQRQRNNRRNNAAAG